MAAASGGSTNRTGRGSPAPPGSSPKFGEQAADLRQLSVAGPEQQPVVFGVGVDAKALVWLVVFLGRLVAAVEKEERIVVVLLFFVLADHQIVNRDGHRVGRKPAQLHHFELAAGAVELIDQAGDFRVVGRAVA